MRFSLPALAVVLTLTSLAFAQITPSLSVSGRLTNKTSGAPLSGSFSINFSLYDASSGGTLLFSESQNSVPVSNGLFQTVISPSSLAFDKDYWLGLAIGVEALSPRQKLTPAPYALYANRAGIANSAATANTLAGIVTVAGSNVNVAGSLAVTGDLGVSGAISAGSLTVGGAVVTPGQAVPLTSGVQNITVASISSTRGTSFSQIFPTVNNAADYVILTLTAINTSAGAGWPLVGTTYTFNGGTGTGDTSDTCAQVGSYDSLPYNTPVVVQLCGVDHNITLQVNKNLTQGVITDVQVTFASTGAMNLSFDVTYGVRSLTYSGTPVGNLIPDINTLNANVGQTLTVGDSITLRGLKITGFSGTNPSCPAGGGFLSRLWSAKTCCATYAGSTYCSVSQCTTPVKWGDDSTCLYQTYQFISGSFQLVSATCTANAWTQALCIGG